MRKIKHSDLAKGLELPYLDPRNHAYAGVIERVSPTMGRSWARYYICQRGPHGLNNVGSSYTIGAINRTFRLP
jgi:hypothetical protein